MRLYGITGYKGYVGSYLLSHYDNFVGLDCDVTNPEDVENCIGSSGVSAVVHLAAKSNVDWCQKPENQKTLANVNLRGTFNVCLAAEKERVEVLLLSSDHVFGGNRGRYKEGDKPNPINQYGLSKYAAEGLQQAFDNLKIVRSSYLFDDKRLKSNLFNIMNRLHIENVYPAFISRSFMYLPHFADSLVRYLSYMEDMPKILHISGYHCVSWYEFMVYWCEVNGIDSKFIVPRGDDLDDVAPRPHKGGLDTSFSKELGFSQFSYIQGILQMKKDSP